MIIQCVDVGTISYKDAFKWQRDLALKRRRRAIDDRLLLLEHPPVFTLGTRDSSSDLLVTEEWLVKNGMEVFKSDRGGKITYHGPGQLVGYLIFDLKGFKLSIPDFVWKVEETLIRLLGHYYLEAERDPKHPGVWMNERERKIAAIGLHVSRGITTHGFSLNVTCDLKPFRYIHPCGIKDRDVTSMERELGWRPSMRDIKHHLLIEFSKVFQTKIAIEGSSSDFFE